MVTFSQTISKVQNPSEYQFYRECKAVGSASYLISLRAFGWELLIILAIMERLA